MKRDKFPGWQLDPDPLDATVPEPEPAPRRTGCSVFALLLTVVLLSSWVPGVSAEEPPYHGERPGRAAQSPASEGAAMTPGLSLPAAEPEPSGGVGPITVLVIRQGTWAYAKASHGPGYLAIPEGPGWHVTVCGPKGCLDRVSTDAGPELWLQRAGRIGDLAAVMFIEVCGPLSAGLCDGSYTITGRADQHPEDPPEHPDDTRMRLEDRPLPQTDAAP